MKLTRRQLAINNHDKCSDCGNPATHLFAALRVVTQVCRQCADKRLKKSLFATVVSISSNAV